MARPMGMIDGTGIALEPVDGVEGEGSPFIQKSETLPLKLQSPPGSAVQRATGSRFGPPCSPVLGFISPSNSGFTGIGVSG